jgi:hypothetical protein
MLIRAPTKAIEKTAATASKASSIFFAVALITFPPFDDMDLSYQFTHKSGRQNRWVIFSSIV